MKAQAINIDWVIGLSLFLSATVAAAFTAVTPGSGLLQQSDRLGETAEVLNDQLVKDTRKRYFRAPLIVRGSETGRIPFESDYYFDSRADNRSGFMETLGEVNVSERKVYAVPRTGNRTYRIGYFGSNVSNAEPEGYLSTGAGWANNSYIAVKTGSPGIQSLRFEGQELLNSSADLSSTSYGFSGNPVRASSLSGKITAYTNTSEVILSDLNSAEFDFGNFSTLYWEEDNSTETLDSSGVYRSGSTQGLVLADLGAGSESVTVTGNISATVEERPDDGVRVTLSAEKAHLKMHENGLDTGYSRIEFERNGWITIGAEKILQPVYTPSIKSLGTLTTPEFEDRYDLEQTGFNVSFGSSWGSRIPLDDVTVRTRRVTEVNRSGKISSRKIRTAIWE